MSLTRREFIRTAAALGATAMWGRADASPSGVTWHERREFFPEGVASGDPDNHSILLWARREPGNQATPQRLVVELSRDREFNRVVAQTHTQVSAASDWTCRVLVGGLQPSTEYWYRFTDSAGNGSRIGRTRTAPAEDDTRPVRFVFVSCQNANQGAQNAYRRMIFEDERAAEIDRLGFVLHLGDFIYEIVWYPEDRPQGMYDRRLRDIVRYEHGEKFRDFHIPTTVSDYRAIYRAYLHDPDLQDARARWPFVNMWDNHEFSWKGWQSLEKFDGKTLPRQTRKVAANQAFFEYQPARLTRPTGLSLERFNPPVVVDAPISHFDEHGMGIEPNNRAALDSLTGYRSLRWGRNVELIVTDQRSYRSEEPLDRDEAQAFVSADFPELVPEEAMEILDAGRIYNNGNAPASIRYGDAQVANFARNSPPQTILGFEQKKWFLERLKNSKATWKVWGNTTATLDMRADPQNLPSSLTRPWPGAAYAGFGGGDHSSAFVERAEIYDFVAEHGITGFATIAGDRHSFWAGLAAKALPPKHFNPVGIAFVTGSISAPTMLEAIEHSFPKEHPLRPLFLGQAPYDREPQPTVNLLLRHGVSSCLEYARSGDMDKALQVSNPDLSPHASFVDMGGHGYAVVRATSAAFEVEFVCIPRPLERSMSADGGALRYRAISRTGLWAKGQSPKIETRVLQGNPKFSIG
jgi:alkaline phosphatase D